jgi:hypothetical protein
MPDGAIQTDFTYHRASRKRSAPLIMISGGPGSGKTFSALKLAVGLAGGGKIYLADTDNSRAEFYAEDFAFEHLNLHEPFRPMIFKAAAERAQREGAAVFIIDNFMHEHVGPGGLLEWHEEINVRMARGDPAKIESTKMLAWIEPKTAHKAMRERLYQLNMPVILCCGAERKIAMVKQTEGRDKGKTIPVDQGLVPICGADIPWAMTVSLMLEDVAKPGVPRPIKALLPALKPIIRLDRPIDEETGKRISAWARGEKGEPAAVTTGSKVGEETKMASPSSEEEPPPSPPPPEGREVDEEAIKHGAEKIAEQFFGTEDRKAHLRLVDDAETRKQIEWLRRNRKDLYERVVNPAIKASWQRTDPKKPQQQGGLV